MNRATIAACGFSLFHDFQKFIKICFDHFVTRIANLIV